MAIGFVTKIGYAFAITEPGFESFDELFHAPIYREGFTRETAQRVVFVIRSDDLSAIVGSSCRSVRARPMAGVEHRLINLHQSCFHVFTE